VARLADGLPQGHSIFAVTAAMPALARTLAFELAPMRVNGSHQDSSTRHCPHRCSVTSSTWAANSCRKTLLMGRVVGPEDLAALAPPSLGQPLTSTAANNSPKGDHVDMPN
jgi:hypothetical protein